MAEQYVPRGVTRAEWIAVSALALNVLTLAFGAGVIWRDVEDHARRLLVQEAKMDNLMPKVERIDANVEFLAQQARDDREEYRSRRAR